MLKLSNAKIGDFCDNPLSSNAFICFEVDFSVHPIFSVPPCFVILSK